MTAEQSFTANKTFANRTSEEISESLRKTLEYATCIIDFAETTDTSDNPVADREICSLLERTRKIVISINDTLNGSIQAAPGDYINADTPAAAISMAD